MHDGVPKFLNAQWRMCCLLSVTVLCSLTSDAKQLTDFERALSRRSLLWRECRDNVTDAAHGRRGRDFLQSYSDGCANSPGLRIRRARSCVPSSAATWVEQKAGFILGSVHFDDPSSRLPLINFSAASIQEAILLTMIRLAAECQKIPPEPISDVQHLKGISGRHISRVRFFIHASCLALASYNEKSPEMFSV